MTKDYLNLLFISYDSGNYIEDFKGYYADIIDNYILVLLNYNEVIKHLIKYNFSDKSNNEMLSLLNNTKFNGFSDYSLLTYNKIQNRVVNKLYHYDYIKAIFCRRIYFDN